MKYAIDTTRFVVSGRLSWTRLWYGNIMGVQPYSGTCFYAAGKHPWTHAVPLHAWTAMTSIVR